MKKIEKINKRWFCIYTNAREEQIAFQELLLQGLDLYFPRYKRKVNHARKSQEKIYPLFPRYFFALQNNEISLSSLKRTRGLANYIHYHDGTPVFVHQEVINFLKAREDSCGYIQLNNQRFNQGDTVVVTEGIFTRLSAVFLHQKDVERARIMLEFMGREHIVSIPLDSLDRPNV